MQRYEYDVTGDLNRCYNVVKMLLCWRLNKKVATENKEKCENVWKLQKYFIFLLSDRVYSLSTDF